MSRTKWVTSLVIAIVGLTASTARAKGGWWHFVNSPATVAAGETLEFTDQAIMFTTLAQADRARTEQGHYAYLIENLDFDMVTEATRHGFDPDWWQPGDATLYEAGTVEFHDGKSNLVDATIHLEIPQVGAGTYVLMLCNLGCTQPLGDVVPSKVTVTADREVAELARRVDSLRWRLATLRTRLHDNLRGGLADHDLRADATALEREFTDLQNDVLRMEQGAQASVRALEKRVESLEKREGFMGVAWVGLGGLLLSALAWRKKKDRRFRRSHEALEGEAVTT